LQRFPLDKIKIDRSFVERLEGPAEAGAIVQAITALAAALGLETTAEGIETEAQRDAVRRLGCVLGQGYLFSRPVDAAGALALLAGQNRVSRAA
jgi:EAL domain-containing protein (putative c-di-GMP-specific phosphodiesterase class I)